MKLLLVAPNRSSFINQDYLNLKESFETDLAVCWSPKQIFSTLKKVKSTDVCFFWFASIRFIPVFLLAKALNKKTVIVAGGYDVSSAPDMDYGGMRPGNLLSNLRKVLLHLADKVITVSDSNTNEAIRNAHLSQTRIKRIYLGFDRPMVTLKTWEERKNQIVMIACCDTESYKIKGFETFLELARTLPDYTFVHIGRIRIQEFQKACYEIPNIRTLGYVENMSEVFSGVLNDSKIILLPSKIESFGASILEGGLHGCMPVVSDSYSLPEIIGEIGSSCETSNVRCFRESIKRIIHSDCDTQKTQDYFLKKFSLKTRKEELFNLLSSIF